MLNPEQIVNAAKTASQAIDIISNKYRLEGNGPTRYRVLERTRTPEEIALIVLLIRAATMEYEDQHGQEMLRTIIKDQEEVAANA